MNATEQDSIQDQFNAVGRDMVGDGGSPNVFFVTDGECNTVALFLTKKDCSPEALLKVQAIKRQWWWKTV